MTEEWQSQKFRQSVIQKINEMLQTTGQDPSKNASVMENHIFKKSRTKDEYLGLVAKLYMHFKDLAQRKPQQAPPPNAEMGQQNMMQDPLNALQNLASQGNRNAQMMSMGQGGPGNPNQMAPGGPVAASNLLQTLNQQRPGQMQQLQGIRGQMPMGGNIGGPGVQGGPNMVGGPGQQMVGQMSGMQMNVMGSGVGGNQNNQIVGNQTMGPLNQMNAGGVGSGGSSTNSGGQGNAVGPSGQMQINAAQLQAGGTMNVNAMNVQQMPMGQMNQNQINMGMNHPQLSQMMSARLNQSGGPMNVGPNTVPQGMQGMPGNMSSNQAGPMHPNNVVSGGPQGGPQVSTANMQANTAQTSNLNQMLSMQQKPNIAMSQANQMFPVQRGVVGQQQFLRQSPSPSTAVQSPAGMSAAAAAVAAQQQQLQMQQQQSGVANQQPPQLSNSQMIPSPALVPSSSPQMSNLMSGNQRNLRQSPNAPLNTPGQVASNSPFNPQEDQLYREKYKQLTKYIEPLKRMVAKIGNDGTNTEKITKMSKLLEILCNPAQRVPLETLLKCEKALEKMEINSYSGQQFGKSSNPLMEVISTTIQSPMANHTLFRTFRPGLELLFGTDISAPISPKIKRVADKSQFEHEIPHVLQGEIARLDQKFKVSLDPSSQNNTKCINLICCLDDRRLPSVPPIHINIPEEYPWTSPNCSLMEEEYSATQFLKTVQSALIARVSKLPKLHSLSHILDTWEIAVRQACSPNSLPACEFTAVFGV